MVIPGDFIGCLILLASLSSVSGLCSACLKEQCYDNGECIIGCVPGFVGEYCNEACPSRCLNKICHLDIDDGTVTCTEGCDPGYCHIQCDLPCPGNCVTCDRQCGSCNVTLCNNRYFGADCEQICSPRYEKCDRETGECIICRRGYFGDECNHKCTACFTRADTIRDKCLSGCDICQSKETCPAGYFGQHCELPCLPGCVNPEVGCNKATGECPVGCVSGYHGLTCNYTCSDNCLSSRCNRATGECSEGCVSGYHGVTCNYTCNPFCVGRICNKHDGICTSGCISGYSSNSDMCEQDSEDSHTAVAIAVPITVCLLAGMVAAAFIYRKRQFRRSQTEHAEKGTVGTDVAEPLLKYKKAEALQQLPDEVQHLKTRTREEIDLITSGMIRVSAVDDVLAKLDKGKRWVTITGNAGDGKTTLGYLVLKDVLQKNFNVFTVDKPEEYEQIAKIKKDWVIMFDDRFGTFLADQRLIKSWLDIIRKFLSINENDQQNNHVIFISRKNVVNESKMYLGRFTEKMFDTECVVDLSVKKLTDERLEILEYHLEHEHVTVNLELKKKVSNIDIAHGFPHCCKMYTKLRSKGDDVDIEEFFESPLKFLDMTTKVLYEDNCKELFQLMIKNDGEFNVFKIRDEDKRQKLRKVEKEQEGSYITVWRNGTCQFAHPSVYDSVLNVINEIDPLFCVQYATLCVIRQKMIISTSDEEDKIRCPCYIIVQPIPDVLKALAERFREEILKGDYSVFTHRLCQSREFSEALVSCCVTTDKNENGSKQFINQPGWDGETMLWTALGNGRMAAVHCLVKDKADVDIQDMTGRTPLHLLCQLMISSFEDDDDYSYHYDDDDDGDDDDDDDDDEDDDDDDDDKRYPVDLDTLRLIITEGRGDVNIGDQYGRTPLHYLFQVMNSAAAGNRHYDDKLYDMVINAVRLIITEGRGDVNIGDQYGQTPLHYLFHLMNPAAADNGHYDVKLHDVVINAMRLIITEGRGDVNICDQYGRTPLHYLFQVMNPAAADGHYDDELQDLVIDAMRLIITEGRGDVNIGDQYGQTPLHNICQVMNSAAADGHYVDKLQHVVINAMQLIITKGRGDINLSDRYGQTPLHYLFKCGAYTVEEIQWIITQGKGDLNKCEQHRSTPLHYLCANSGLQLDTVDLVINERKSDFNAGDEHGTTPLHYLGNGKLECDVVLQIVNTANGDINKQDNNGITPLHVLCKGSLPMEDILTVIKQGDKTDMYGNTPLHFLCRRRGINIELLQLKLEQIPEKDRKKQNDLGYTPLDYLSDHGNVLHCDS